MNKMVKKHEKNLVDVDTSLEGETVAVSVLFLSLSVKCNEWESHHQYASATTTQPYE
jgi:hypothetical protein